MTMTRKNILAAGQNTLILGSNRIPSTLAWKLVKREFWCRGCALQYQANEHEMAPDPGVSGLKSCGSGSRGILQKLQRVDMQMGWPLRKAYSMQASSYTVAGLQASTALIGTRPLVKCIVFL